MERRVSSILSLRSNLTDSGINDSRLSASNSISSPSSLTIPRKSLPNLRALSSSRTLLDARSGRSTTHSMYLHPSTPPTPEDGNGMLQPVPLLKPSPEGSNSPGGSRASSSIGRPERHVGSYSRDGSRVASSPCSPSTFRPLTPTKEAKTKKRRSWMPGKTTLEMQNGHDIAQTAQAWVITPQEKMPYDLSPLLHFQPVSELWDEGADTLVYLHNRPSGLGPTLRVDSASFASSKKLVEAAYGGTQSTSGQSRQSSLQHHDPSEMQHRSFAERSQRPAVNATTSPIASWHGSNRSSSTGAHSSHGDFDDAPQKKDIHLYLAQPLQADLTVALPHLTGDDIETLITVRNLFAFLLDKPLVATARRPSIFEIFMHIAGLLHRYQFTNFDGSTIGEEAASSFSRFVEGFRIADVRTSREKTIEAIILGEQMKNYDLYNEGFVHAVGKYNDIATFKSPKLHQISGITRKRLERANLFLSTQLRNVHGRLDDFDFPSLFAGIANSTTSSESKVIRFKAWKSSFMAMRRHVMAVYKQRYGAWPPKARSKKNEFEESGLNRLLLRQVYQDFCDLYDVLVDRTSFTTRHVEIPSEDGPDDPHESSPRALRRLLSEYDRSTPPVQPPIPFDTPLLPSLSSTRRDFYRLEPRKQKKESTKKLKDSEINTALMQSYNRDLMKSTAFLEAFFAYERRSAHGKSIEEIADLRNGQWIFMYAVIQSLPLLVVDAPGLRYTEGVEYFLSEFSKESPPWMRHDHRQKTTWRIPGSDTMVDMPAASVEHSNDAIYQRSHCWQVAQQWAEPIAIAGVTSQYDVPYEGALSPIIPMSANSRANSRSPNRRLSIMALGLEQLPVPSGVGFSPSGSRPTSTYDPSKSFDAILGLQDGQGKKKKSK
ncbi:MAG: hypothetical protein Q9217_000711 [Psora testacea]